MRSEFNERISNSVVAGTSIEVAGPTSSSADVAARRLLDKCTHPRHEGDNAVSLYALLPLVCNGTEGRLR